MGLGLGTLNGILGGAGGLSGGLKSGRTPSATSSLPNPSTTPSPTTPTALKKPLLPNCVLNKTLGSSGGSLGYRLPRPGQAKQQKPLLSALVKRDVKPSASTEGAKDNEPTREAEKADSHTDSDGSSGGEGKRKGGDELMQCSRQAAGETVEDMSFSSASSLDRGDTSEEFLDDFDSVGDVLSDGDLPDNKETGSAQNRLPSFLRETMEWGSVDLTGKRI